MRIVTLLLFLFLQLSCDPGFDELPQTERSPLEGRLMTLQEYGGSEEDHFSDMVQTTDGGIALLGFSNSMDGELEGKLFPGNDYWLLRLDNGGRVLWSRAYGGSKDDRGQAIVATSDGGFAIAGYSMSADGDASQNQGYHDNWVLKLDADGSVQWEKSFGFGGHDHAYDLAQTTDGGFFLAGFLDVTASGGAGESKGNEGMSAHGVGEFWVNRLQPDGEVAWRKYYGGSNNDRAHAMALSHDGGLVLAGFTESDDFDISDPKGSYDFWVTKIDADGKLIWQRTFGGSGIDIAHDVIALPSGGYLVVGQTYSRDVDVSGYRGGGDAWVIEIDEDGKMVWDRTYGGENFDVFYDATILESGGFLLGGSSRSVNNGAGESDFWTMEVDAKGKIRWEATHGTAGIDELHAASISEDGKHYFAGTAGVGEAAQGVLLQYHPGGKIRF